eukprot:TRINITY_DN60171_c0_g1_i2.p1 TRINITY_DN60171_c0_g1~~TRINITY_DN60171_c0_g1_i2.p1  ORF type:complete len:319 (+),score=78.84 TRINITY_DN60171_c0_g1_i2:44-1000(+)
MNLWEALTAVLADQAVGSIIPLLFAFSILLPLKLDGSIESSWFGVLIPIDIIVFIFGVMIFVYFIFYAFAEQWRIRNLSERTLNPVVFVFETFQLNRIFYDPQADPTRKKIALVQHVIWFSICLAVYACFAAFPFILGFGLTNSDNTLLFIAFVLFLVVQAFVFAFLIQAYTRVGGSFAATSFYHPLGAALFSLPTSILVCVILWYFGFGYQIAMLPLFLADGFLGLFLIYYGTCHRRRSYGSGFSFIEMCCSLLLLGLLVVLFQALLYKAIAGDLKFIYAFLPIYIILGIGSLVIVGGIAFFVLLSLCLPKNPFGQG